MPLDRRDRLFLVAEDNLPAEDIDGFRWLDELFGRICELPLLDSLDTSTRRNVEARVACAAEAIQISASNSSSNVTMLSLAVRL
jgi:hypothetical protein